MPSGRLVALVDERRAGVRIGGVGIEADDGALGIGAVAELGAEDGWLVGSGSVTVQVKLSVSVSVPSLTVMTCCRCPSWSR